MRQVALVTGGSRGIGRAIAIELAEKGFNVVINYSGNEEAAKQTAQCCAQHQAETMLIKADVSNETEVIAMMEQIKAKFGQLDVLINNAGIVKDGLIIRMSEEDYQKVMDINAKGCFLCTKEAAKMMMKSRSGKIVNMASVIGVIGNAGQMNYAASKGAVIAMTKSAAKELASRNILVNAIAPGYIMTDMTQGLNEKIQETIQNVIPLKRFGQDGDVAKLVAFLAGNDNQYITGQIIHVDGGMVM